MQLPLADGFMGITTGQWALFAAVVALIFAIRRWRLNVWQQRQASKMRERELPLPTARGNSMRDSNMAGLPGKVPSALNVREVTTEIHAMLGDLEETARRVIAQFDNRRVRLEQMIAEADERIKKLESLAGTTQPVVKAAVPVNVSREATQALNRLREERGAPPANEDPAYQPVYQLADQGKTSREIGQALGRQPGEIELILALRGRQRV
jgi:hypothetical protein